MPDSVMDDKFLESHQEYWQYIYDEFGVLNFLVESQAHNWINKLKNNENIQQFNDTQKQIRIQLVQMGNYLARLQQDTTYQIEAIQKYNFWVKMALSRIYDTETTKIYDA